MLILTPKGLYCPYGDFYIDPNGKVDNAVVTHAHSDHARRGSQKYFCTTSGEGLLRARLGQKIQVETHPYGQRFQLGDVQVSFHPAGHILGSSQVRLQRGREVWVASGDYKREYDPTCEPFEVVPCDVYLTEATFGTPAYRWNKSADLGQEIIDWWHQNRDEGVNSVLFGYSLGKTQRVLGVLRDLADEPVYTHPAAKELIEAYRREGVELAPNICLSDVPQDKELTGALFLGPRALLDEKFAGLIGPDYKTAFASGWMAKKGQNPHREPEHGFVMPDHADWDDLVGTVLETGAKRVYVQHRGHGALVRHLRTLGVDAHPDSDLIGERPNTSQLSFGWI